MIAIYKCFPQPLVYATLPTMGLDSQNPTENSEEKSPLWIKAYNSLIRYLGARDHSEKELRIKLSQKYPENIAEEMVALAYENNWMANPQELAQRTAERLMEKGKGPRYITNYLSERGLPEVSIDREEALKLAREVAEMKFGDLKELNYDERPKVQRFLQGRGFSHGVISTVIFEN